LIDYLLLIPIGYLLGSVPFGVIAGRLSKGVDVRDYGSGSTGMTNVLRTVGVRAAAIVLLLDMGKAVLAVVLARLLSGSPGVGAAAALAVVVGHNWPIFIGFRGGKGSAPAWGGLLILSPVAGVVASVVGAAAVAITRHVSLGSIIGAGSGAVVLIVLYLVNIEPLAYVWYVLISGLLVVVRHKDNIKRLIRGEERKLGQPADGTPTRPENGRDKGLRWPRSA
jgi:glycerol-3-phosphate acyltransferase PlsY